MPPPKDRTHWKGPTIREIAELSGLSTATVDRVVNGRSGVRDATREQVNAAMQKLSRAATSEDTFHIRLICDSGPSFNRAMHEAAVQVNRTVPGVLVDGVYSETSQFDAETSAQAISDVSDDTAGLIVVGREHPAINQAVRQVRRADLPVVCLTTDLPSSRRNVYIGNDQYAAGSAAGQLIGHALGPGDQRILIVMSQAFRCQQEREMGFRRVLRAAYPHLHIEERVISDDVPETTYDQLSRYFETRDAPTAIYNAAGANRGVARALEVAGLADSTIFVGHELTPITQMLLESGTMDYVISHDVFAELRAAVQWITNLHAGIDGNPMPSQILIHTRYNCHL